MKKLKVLIPLMVFFFFTAFVYAGPPGSPPSPWKRGTDGSGNRQIDADLDRDGTAAVTIVDDGNGNFVIEGSFSAGIDVASTISTNTTLTASQITGGFIPLSGDGTTVTMPAVSASTVGKFVTFYVTDATAKHIDSNASDKFTLSGTATDDGDKLSIGASNTGAVITLYCLDTDGWVAPKGTDGAWSDGGA